MHKVFINTIPFGDKNKLPLEVLDQSGIEYLINPLGRKPSEDELIEIISDFDAVIAGTETISKKVINRSNKLKMISRAGIGLNGVDLEHGAISVQKLPDLKQ